MTINTEVQKLEPSGIVELFELDATDIGGGIVRFQSQSDKGIVWQGNEYAPWPIKAEGFARTAEQQPTPKLLVGNVDGSISMLCLAYEDLVGAKLTRRRTFTKFLDDVNFDGDELVTDNDFTSYGSGWVNTFNVIFEGDTATAIGGQGEMTNGVANVVSGQSYRVRYNRTNPEATSIRLGIKASIGDIVVYQGGWHPEAGVVIFEFTATASGHLYVEMEEGAQLGYVSVREVLGNPEADPTEEFPPEIWFIERKSTEARTAVEFELASALNFADVKLPRRQVIANQCPFAYRGAYCGYTGPAVADANDVPTVDPALDRCGKRLSSCKLREWPDDILNFGGFPAAGLVRT